MERLVEAAGAFLRREMARSEPLRELVLRLGEWLAAEATALRAPEGGEGAADVDERPPPADVAHDAPGPLPPAAPPVPSEVVTLRLGNATVQVPVNGTPGEIQRAMAAAEVEPKASAFTHPVMEAGARVDLGVVERRCRLKAEACRLFVERRAAAGDPARERPLIEALTAMLDRRLALPDCFLWMLTRRQQPADADLERIAACYDALAETAALIQYSDTRARDGLPAGGEYAMQLLAEAGSALRVALQETWLSDPDTDQAEVHAWLSREGAVRRVFLPRYMRRDDPADPARAPLVIGESRALRQRIEGAAGLERRVGQLLGRMAYHAGKLARNGGAADPHDGRRIVETIEEVCALGLAPEDARIARAIRGVDRGQLPPEIVVTPAAARAIEAARPAADLRPEPADDVEAPRAYSPRILELRRLIEGTTIVIAGGERRPAAADRIQDAFALAGVEWVRLEEHGRGEALRAPIERKETSLVVVLVRFIGHGHGEDATRCARRAGKPCVFVKAGYNPEQIAEAALDQAGSQLRDRPARFGA